MSEFYSMKNTNEALIFTKIDEMINKLASFFKITMTNGKSKFSVIVKFYSELFKGKNSIQDLIVIKEVVIVLFFYSSLKIIVII